MPSAISPYSAESEREQLILDHLQQVRWIAASIAERLPAVAEEDLVSAGVVGLIQAIDNFDPARSASLRTYAEIRIRGAILDSIRGLDGVDPHKRGRMRLVQSAIAAVEQRIGRAATEEEIAAELSLPLAEYHAWLAALRGINLGSLDTVASEDGDDGLLAYVADPRQEDPAISIERAEMSRLLAAGIRAMPETERLILDLYFHQELTLNEIGRVMGVHLSRVCQIKSQAILRMRSYLECRLGRRKA